MDLLLLITIIVLIVLAFKGKHFPRFSRIVAIITTVWEPLVMLVLLTTYYSRTRIMFDIIISMPIFIVGTHLYNLTKYIATKNDKSWWKIDWHGENNK